MSAHPLIAVVAAVRPTVTKDAFEFRVVVAVRFIIMPAKTLVWLPGAAARWPQHTRW